MPRKPRRGSAMTRTLRGQAAIIGTGRSQVGRVPGRSPLPLAADATRAALADAGLQKADLDGVLACSAFAAPFHRFSVAFSEDLGIQPTFSNTLQVSGATAATLFNVAAAAIAGGLADTVLVVGADSLLTGLTPDLTLRSLTESRDQQYEMPFGIPVANTFAMTAQRHMLEYGTTPEQLAMVAVIERAHAAATPGAQMTAPITVDDVLSSGWVTTPYHKLDCSLISDGGAAFVVTSAARARALGIAKPVYILGGGECYTHEHIFLMPSLTTTGAVQSSARAYAMAGCTPRDIDVAGVYDCFTGTVVMMLEDLGFCPKGDGGPFAAEGVLAPGGALPANTSGGGLAYTHPGMFGIFLLVEAVRQLRGECGARQVEGAELGLVHSLGGGFATQATTILGTAATL